MRLTERLSNLLWLVVLAYTGFYLWLVVTGLLDPIEMVVTSVGALVLTVGFVVHAFRVRDAMHDHDHPAHAPMMRRLHDQRERRGF